MSGLRSLHNPQRQIVGDRFQSLNDHGFPVQVEENER